MLSGRGFTEREAEAIEVHHPGSGGDEVGGELLLAVGAAIHFGDGAEDTQTDDEDGDLGRGEGAECAFWRGVIPVPY